MVPLSFAGQEWLLTEGRALYWPRERALLVADLHLEKGAAFARRGMLLPPYDTAATLARLHAAIARYNPKTILSLGDSFHDRTGSAHMPPAYRDALNAIQQGRDWIWIEGNHDPGPVGIGGSHLAELSLGPLTFRHIAQARASGEVSGHYHPKARLRLRGRALTRPCFLVDRSRLILPAYGAYTGGLHCDTAVLTGLMAPGATAILTGPSPVAVSTRRSPVACTRLAEAESTRARLVM